MRQQRAFVTTARRAAQHITRYVRTPADDERRERYRPAMFAGGTVEPEPRRAAPKLPHRRDWWKRF
jgi:hypothetical protein